MIDKDYSSAANLLKVELSNHVLPMFLDSKSKDWVKYGENNNYPDYLIELYNRNATHGAIVKGKSQYIFGKGLELDTDDYKSVNDLAKAQLFLEHANRFESWNDLVEKTVRYFELFNGWAWQIVWSNGGGKIAEVYCMEFSKLRRSKCGNKIYYCDKWVDDKGYPVANPEKDPSFKCFDAFNPNIRTGTQIYYFKVDAPVTQKYGHLYPIPEYVGAVADIETDVEITMFHYYNLKNGMFASALLSLFNGEPSPEEKKKIAKMFNYTHTGTINTGKIIFSFNDKGGTAPTLQTLTPADLDKMFEQLSKRLQQNIFTAHRVDPVLFGVMTEGSLSDTGGQAIIAKWDKFLRAYVELRQNVILREIKAIGDINGVDLSELEFEQMTPLQLELPSDPNIHKLFDVETLQKYYAKKYGIELDKPNSVNGDGEVSDTEELRVNEHLKKLSGRDWQHIKRMIREVKNGKTELAVANMMLKNAYGLSDEDLRVLFNSSDATFRKFDAQVDYTEDVLALFSQFAIDDPADEYDAEEQGDIVHFHSAADAAKYELRKVKEFYANPYRFLSDGESNVLGVLKGNPTAKPEDVAKQLGMDVVDVAEIIAALVAAGYLLNLGNTFEPTPKATQAELPKPEIEPYYVYAYELSSDAPTMNGGKRIKSRPFCERLVAMSKMGKRWTQESIDKITATAKEQLSMPDGWDAWSYRGGFYTNHNSGETTPYCRHVWRSVRKLRRKK